MGIIVDPNKSLVTINIMYVEEPRPYGNSIFRFIRSKEEFDELKSQGYISREEYNAKRQNIPPGTQPEDLDPLKVMDKVSTMWKMLSWSEQNNIYAQCVKEDIGPDGKTNTRFDGIKFRDLKLKTCLKSWDLKDENGRSITLNPSMIDNLDPDFAQEMIATFEKVTEPTPEEESEDSEDSR